VASARFGTQSGNGCAERQHCDTYSAVRGGIHQPSGRIIALGRLLLATLYVVAIWIDFTQPHRLPVATFSLLGGYMLFAAAMVALTWKSWWRDARLTGPAHAVDIVVFTALVFLTDGYTSPFFIFFVFLLLAAAIRWGWRETTLTALLLVVLYFSIGLLASEERGFDLYRFLIRTGHLVILSLILVWFGANQWRARYFVPAGELTGEPTLDQSPFKTSLKAAVRSLRADRGILVWLSDGRSLPATFTLHEGELVVGASDAVIREPEPVLPFLYDIRRQRGLSRNLDHDLILVVPDDVFSDGAADALGLLQGLAIPVRAGAGDGWLFLEGIPNLSTDHIDLGEQLAGDMVTHIQHHALLKAAAENAEARSRLSLARDLHDSVVQFLAGAAFRLEAMKRSAAGGRALDPELTELKELMLLEQGELRSFITALRSGAAIRFSDLAKGLEALTQRLSRQWDVDCRFSTRDVDVPVPTSVNLDAQQLVREAVANAVRHAGAKTVKVALDADEANIRLDFVNDGKSFRGENRAVDMPQTLQERVVNAGGTIELSRGMGVTKFSITLPLGGTQQ
jgi:signal transduction histidine kinase